MYFEKLTHHKFWDRERGEAKLRELKSDLFSWAGPHCEGWGPLGLECTPKSTQSCQCIWKKHWAWYRIKATWYRIKHDAVRICINYSSLYNSTGSEQARLDSSGIKTPLKRPPLEGSIRFTKTDAPQTKTDRNSLGGSGSELAGAEGRLPSSSQR